MTMRNTRLSIQTAALVILAIFVVAPERTPAQCEYATASSYVTYSMNASATTIYSTVVTEGQVICSYNGMQHTYYATNTLNGVGGTESEGPTANYVSLENDQSIGVSYGEIVTFDCQSEVYCPMMGYFYNSFAQSHLEIAFTRDINAGKQQNCTTEYGITICDISVLPWCTAATSPPDWNPLYVRDLVYPVAPPTFWDTASLCFRYGTSGPWTCAPGAALERYFSPSLPLDDCTHNP